MTSPAEDIGGGPGIHAHIDWDKVERHATLSDLTTDAVFVEARPPSAVSGTRIELTRLRRSWSPAEQLRFVSELDVFRPPATLLSLPPSMVDPRELLFEIPRISDTCGKDPGFNVQLLGDLEGSEDYWSSLAQLAEWILEIDSTDGQTSYNILPTRNLKRQKPGAKGARLVQRANPQLPNFQARILVRTGQAHTPQQQFWHGRARGIRVYLEGFRVPPYGEHNDDWLGLDAAYAKRSRAQRFPEQLEFAETERGGLHFLPSRSYLGAVFLTQTGAPSLRMLVNREGFIPEEGFYQLREAVKTGTDLLVRTRAALDSFPENDEKPASPKTAGRRTDVARSLTRATELSQQAKSLAREGKLTDAAAHVDQAIREVTHVRAVTDEQISALAMYRVLASLGTQMAAFVHEIQGLLAAAFSLESMMREIEKSSDLEKTQRKGLARLRSAIGELRRAVERQASYLTDVTTADSRRRRARLVPADRFDSAARFVELAAAQDEIAILNEIPRDLRSRPMFPAELTMIFSNLLTNAVKAAGNGGKIRATGAEEASGVNITVENTGVSVAPEEGERWFLPFESTTASADAALGQGMGMGLPLTRSIVEEYGGEIKFVKPSVGYATAVKVWIPT